MDTVDPAVGLGLGYLWPHQTCGKMKEAILTHRLGTRGGGGGARRHQGSPASSTPYLPVKPFPLRLLVEERAILPLLASRGERGAITEVK